MKNVKRNRTGYPIGTWDTYGWPTVVMAGVILLIFSILGWMVTW